MSKLLRRPNRPPNEGVFRLSVAQFLVALVVMLLSVPYLTGSVAGRLIEAVLMTLVLLSAVVAVGGRRRSLVTGILLVTPALISHWLGHFRPDLVEREITQVTAMLFIGFVIIRLLHFVLTARQVNSEVLCAGVAIYLLLGLIWAFAYVLVARLTPDSFAFTIAAAPDRSMTSFAALYFSFCTLTTVGYGDIVPISSTARLLSMVESTSGVFFATILIARLVALYSGRRLAEPE